MGVGEFVVAPVLLGSQRRCDPDFPAVSATTLISEAAPMQDKEVVARLVTSLEKMIFGPLKIVEASAEAPSSRTRVLRSSLSPPFPSLFLGSLWSLPCCLAVKGGATLIFPPFRPRR